MHRIDKYSNSRTFTSLVFIIAGIGLIFFSSKIFKLFKQIFSMFETNEDNLKETISEFEGSINKRNLNNDESYYAVIADQQEKAMQYSGTNFDLLKSILKNLNSDELKLVFVKFGLRYNYVFGISDTVPSNLLAWYRDELRDYSLYGKSQIQEMQEIWDKTGLKI